MLFSAIQLLVRTVAYVKAGSYEP